MTYIAPISFEHHLFAPPLDLPFGMRSGGSIFCAQRQRTSPAYFRPHEGIDLYPKQPPVHRPTGSTFPNSVYAVNWGTVELVEDHPSGSGQDWEVVIRHHPHSSGIYTLYRHLIAAETGIAVGVEVEAGQRIGTLDSVGTPIDNTNLSEPPCLHFVWSRATDPADPYEVDIGTAPNRTTVRNRIPLDATPLLYRFEAYRWHVNRANVPRYHHDNSYPYSKIERIRAQSWPIGGNAGTWLFEVVLPPDAEDRASFFLPINDALPHEELMVDILRDAFHHGNGVRLGWHDSHFYGDHRWMIHDVRVRP